MVTKKVLSRLNNVYDRLQSAEDIIKGLIEENNDKTARILALEEKSILQENTIEQLSTQVEKLQVEMTDTNTEFQEQATQLAKFQETSNDIEEGMETIDAKMDNIELII